MTTDTSSIKPRPASRGTNQIGVRFYNERLVLSLIRRHGELPKADIARMTGLSPQTISIIMNQLTLDGLLQARHTPARQGWPAAGPLLARSRGRSGLRTQDRPPQR